MKIKILGLGHEMTGDDEIGLVIVRRWQELHGGDYSKEGVESQILESPGINLLGTIAGLDAAVLTAAVHGGAPPGTIHLFRDKELEELPTSCSGGSARGAAETLSLGSRLIPEDLPEVLVLIGIQGAAFRLGEGLSPAVLAAVPEAISVINQIVDDLLQ
jgi:hydrogenase maturation protease